MFTFSVFLNEEKLPKSLLLEGGNVQIGGHSAQHIDVEQHDRQAVSDLIMKGLVEFNNTFKDEYGLHIWKPSVLKDGKVFSGSTKHFFDQRISAELFKKHKKTVGDIDTMVDVNLKSQVKDFLEAHKDEEFGPLQLIGHKLSGDQTITLWKLQPTDINIQIDLEFVEFQDSKPTPWSEFSHSSSFSDMENGIKGAFHKILMTSLLGHTKTDSVLQLKTKEKDIKAGTHALSIKGLRKKYEKIGMKDGKPVIKETGSKEFNTNFYEILKHAFDIDATEEDVTDFWSFIGILKLIKKHLQLEKRQKVLDEFVDRLFGEGAQGLYRDDPNRDLDEKMTALKLAQDKLGIKYDKVALDKLQRDFYSSYK